MRLLLSGGTGFFGRALLRFLGQANCFGNRPSRLYIISRDPSQFLRVHPEFAKFSWVEWVRGDLTTGDVDGLADPFKRFGGITHVLHAAAESSSRQVMSPQTQFDHIIQGTRTMLGLAIKLGSPRFLFTSSGAVYGQRVSEMAPVSESELGAIDPSDPKSGYSLAKLASEHLCALARNEHGLPVIVCRPFTFSGPDLPLDVHFAVGNFVRDALFSRRISLSGDGSPVRSYLDQNDLAEWLMTLLVDGQPGQTYNIGSDSPISIYDLAHLVRDLVSPAKKVAVLARQIGEAPRQFYVPDTSKVRGELGLLQRISLEESILRMAHAHRL